MKVLSAGITATESKEKGAEVLRIIERPWQHSKQLHKSEVKDKDKENIMDFWNYKEKDSVVRAVVITKWTIFKVN